MGEVTFDPSVEERQGEPSTSTSTSTSTAGSAGDHDLDTECHLWALTHRLDDDLVVPIVAFPKGQARVIATASWGRLGPALDAVRSHRERCDIYVGIYAIEKARMRRVISEGRRGTQSEVDAVVAVIADVDIAGPNHRAETDYPRTVEEAQAVVSNLGIEPTLLLHTGGGLAAWWILERPVTFHEDHRTAIRSEVLELFANGIDHAASQIGREVDHLPDLTRVMRLAGTVNYKHGGSDPVQMMSWNPDIVLTDDELAGACVALAEPASPPRSTPTTERSTNRLAALTDGPNILTHAIDPLPWSAIWPAGWTRRKDTVIGGVIVERWKRPGSSHDHSAVCWPDGGCKVHSDAVPGLPAGDYSKAEVVAGLAGITVQQLASDLWRRGAA